MNTEAPSNEGGEPASEAIVENTASQAPEAANPADGFFDPNEDSSGDVDPATPATTEGAGEPDPEHGQEGEPDPKTGQSVQERIDEITAGRREAERVAAEAAREVKELREKVEALTPKGDDATVDPNSEPDPVDYEFGEADPEFTRDLARFTARQEFQQQERTARLKGTLAELDTKWSTNTTTEDVKTRYPDFDEKVTKGAETNAWACPPLVALGIKDSEVGADVAYHLASNPEESRSVAKMNGIEQARHFGRLEGRFLAERETRANPQPKTVTTTQAPEPPSARTRGAGGKFSVDPDTDDFKSFQKMAAPIINKRR